MLADNGSFSEIRTPGRPLKITRIISGLWPGGVEKKLTLLLPLLDRSRFDVSVVCLKSEGELAKGLRENGINVVVRPVLRRWSPGGLWRLSRYLKDQKTDIVHTHMYRSNVSGAVAARLAGVPVIISNIHNVENWDNKGQIRTDRWISRFRDCTIFVSEAVRRDYIARISLSLAAQQVIYNGVDTNFFHPAETDHTRESSDRLNVGVAARLMPQKGLDLLVRAAAETELQAAGVHFYIAGNGPLEKELTELAASSGASSFFHIEGFTKNIREFYRKLDVFAMPSHREGFSNALLEAMACGVPPVATAVGGNPEAVEDGISGFLTPPSDYPSFLGALKKILFDSVLRRRMAAAAVIRARRFSLDEMVRQTEELYLTLWAKKAQ